MNMAAEWNAIVLLDEADVFLQKRSPENYSRNERIAGRFLLYNVMNLLSNPKANETQSSSGKLNTIEVNPYHFNLKV